MKFSSSAARARRFAVLAATLVFAWTAGAAPDAPGNTNTAAVSEPGKTPNAQVVIVRDLQATAAYAPVPGRVRVMVNRGVTRLTGRANVKEAWLSLVTTQDVVGIKVYSEPGPNSGTRPAVAAAVIEGLLAAGVPARQIIIWDKRREDLRVAGFHRLARETGVRLLATSDAGYDSATFYETPLLGALTWGDHEFGSKADGAGRKSFAARFVSGEITRIISITPLLNHNEAGVAGNLYSLALGSVDNTSRFAARERLATAVPEIYALPFLSDRVALNIVDALVCQYEGEERSLLHYSAALNELRFSRDPVALDVLSLEELARQRALAGAPAVKENLDLYKNASLLELGISDIKRINRESVSQ